MHTRMRSNARTQCVPSFRSCGLPCGSLLGAFLFLLPLLLSLFPIHRRQADSQSGSPCAWATPKLPYEYITTAFEKERNRNNSFATNPQPTPFSLLLSLSLSLHFVSRQCSLVFSSNRLVRIKGDASAGCPLEDDKRTFRCLEREWIDSDRSVITPRR